jgi:cytochrome c2
MSIDEPAAETQLPRRRPRWRAALVAARVAALAAVAGAAAAQSAAQPELPATGTLDRLAAESRARWETSPHGLMLARILPERVKPSQLPDPASRGARLTALYCVQCHHLPNPAMHEPARWAKVVDRMVPRMQGKGNMGKLMAEMMLGSGGDAARPLAAPSPAEAREIVAYLQRHAMRPIDAALAPALESGAGQMFEQACSQCHALPDPRQHTAGEWPAVVRRMESNMEWMNRIVGSRRDPREPQLRPEEIVAFLQRHARRPR